MYCMFVIRQETGHVSCTGQKLMLRQELKSSRQSSRNKRWASYGEKGRDQCECKSSQKRCNNNQYGRLGVYQLIVVEQGESNLSNLRVGGVYALYIYMSVDLQGYSLCTP